MRASSAISSLELTIELMGVSIPPLPLNSADLPGLPSFILFTCFAYYVSDTPHAFY